MEEQTEYRTYTCNLRTEQVRMLKSLDNASEFIRNAIDKATTKTVKKKKPKPQKKKELTDIERLIIIDLIDDANMSDHSTSHMFTESKKTFRYIMKPVYWPMTKEAILNRIYDPKKWSHSNIEDKQKFIKKCTEKNLIRLFEEATRQWLSKYPENWKVQITPKWTLGQVMFQLEDQQLEEVTVAEIAAIMGVSYNVAYNKAMPLLMAEGLTFVRKR